MKNPESELTPKQRNIIRRAMAKLPPISVVVQKILLLTTDPGTTVDDLATAVEGDQVLAAKVIRLVNSPFFGLEREVTSIRQAVIFLGFNTIRQLVMSVSFGYAFDFIPAKDRERFWKHSLAVAILARKLGEMVPGVDTERLFAAGLLHDIGILVLYTAFHDEYQDIMARAAQEGRLDEHERDAFGIDHAEVGFALGKEWNFPERILEVIFYHHRVPPLACGTAKSRLDGPIRSEVEIVALADYLSVLTASGLQNLPDKDPCWRESSIIEKCSGYMPPSPELVSFMHREIMNTIESYGVS